jgi:mono/diheme cytochrome c family protein
MPSFSLLPNSEVEALVEYVKYLAIRGEMERRLVDYVYQELGEEEVEGEDGEITIERTPLDPANNPDQAEFIKQDLAAVLEPWQAAAESVVVPEDAAIPQDDRTPEQIAESVAKGRDLFYGTKANCFSCHGPTGLGDGQQTDFDIWNKEQNEFNKQIDELVKKNEELENKDDVTEEDEATLESNREQLAKMEPVAATFYKTRNAIPRNLRKGIYRGGRRRIDIFSRVHQGIAGTPMPGIGAASPGAQGALSEQEIWNIVDYVLSLPYEAASAPQPALKPNLDPIAN